MKLILSSLRELLSNSRAGSNLYKRNLLKSYLQIVVLDWLYANPLYSDLLFYGGSALAQCYGLPRLSEDLDFVDIKKKISLAKAASDIEKYFLKNTDLPVKASVQKFRVYLKFPVLKTLGLALAGETDLLFLKLEIFSNFNFCKKYLVETVPLFKHNYSILIKTFDLPTLMGTKLRAILYRKWEKSDNQGNVIVRAKGRDYFDLMWYLERGIKPNLACLPEFKNIGELKKELTRIIFKLDEQSIRLDLEALLENNDFVSKLSKNLKEILIRDIETKLGD